MEPSREEVLALPKMTEPIDTLNGIFQKKVFFLNNNFSKSLTIGIFKNRDYSLGVMFKGRHDHVYWSFETFNQFSVNFDNVSKALQGNTKFYLELNEKSAVKVLDVFGVYHVFLSEGESTLTLNSSEWRQFVSNIPLIHLELRDLFYEEDLIKQFICGGSNSPSPFILNRLVLEIARENDCCS